MDDFLYFIIIIGLTIFIIFFGGHNNHHKIEYNIDNLNYLNMIINFEKKINLIYLNNTDIFTDKNFVNIDKYFNTANTLIPNFVNYFLIKINPNSFFNIFNLIDKSIAKSHMMIIFNHNKQNNLKLVIGENNNHQIHYDLEKNISITSIYHIYNDSNSDIIVSCIFLKKPFWNK